jgi:hypothetical protein
MTVDPEKTRMTGYLTRHFAVSVTADVFHIPVGIYLFRVVQIDGAYAWDNYIYDNAVFVSVRFGW